jgi:hypothetical protein
VKAYCDLRTLRFLRLVAWTGAAPILQGCGRDNLPPPPPPAPASPGTAEPETDVRREPAPETDDAPQQIDGDLAEVLRRCKVVDESRDIPVGCRIEEVDDGSRMTLTLANRDAYRQMGEDAIQVVAQPYCNLANNRGVNAQVVIALYAERVMKAANCSGGGFNEWAPIDHHAAELAGAARACDALQQSSLPVGCEMGEVDGVPSLVVSYRHSDMDPAALKVIADRIAVPFCDAMHSNGTTSNIYLIEDASRAKGFSCATGQSTDWIHIARQEPRQQSREVVVGATAPSRRSSAGGSAKGMGTRTIIWRTIK